MAAIKTYFRVTDEHSGYTDKHGKLGELVEFTEHLIRLRFEDGKLRSYFHDEVTEADLPIVELVDIDLWLSGVNVTC